MAHACKILVVDDDLNLRRGLDVRLRALGYQTAFASDGASAIAVARREQPSVILLDVGLPGGDGFLVLDRLRQLTSVACIPVVVITARPAEENCAKALEKGACAFLSKPLDNEALAATLARLTA